MISFTIHGSAMSCMDIGARHPQTSGIQLIRMVQDPIAVRCMPPFQLEHISMFHRIFTSIDMVCLSHSLSSFSR